MQTTSFWAAPYESRCQSLVHFKSFTAENYKKIKQKEHQKVHNLRLKSQHDSSNNGYDIIFQAGGTNAALTSAVGRGLDAGHDCVLEASALSQTEGGHEHESATSPGLLLESPSVSLGLDEGVTSFVSVLNDQEVANSPKNCSEPSVAPSHLGHAFSMLTNDEFEMDKGATLPREAALKAPESGIDPADGCLSNYTDLNRGSDPDAHAAFASSTLSDSMDFGETQVTTVITDAEHTNGSSMLLQASQTSVEGSLFLNEDTDLGQEWTQQKDSLLHHLRSTAGLPWSRIALYFPHTSSSEVRRRFAEHLAAVPEHEKNVHPPERKRGRPRKCDHPLAGTGQRRRNLAEADASQSCSTRRGSDGSRASPGLEIPSLSNHPSLAKRRGRKRKVTPASKFQTTRSSNTPIWTVDRIVGTVEINGRQHYRVRWEETLEPVENLQGCANTAIAEYHLRHVL
ncbi:hypothetical protein LTR78_009322 [Recurvomyces mirabilis]|uniref:Myb-like domain-containing protein n=1 Tax=Recurvomyces mirabilis TaxID=574656 RepID=A0AAE0WIH5_9PEZI|nr:hypothetical protein LTR78_009322 [Recurvomyces mirabilis]KAK5150325.1 hypothetical protein LTS14_010164 [Recurvomyces mirabilis]